MNKTKIDWCDMTFNPVTGCLYNCPYCYARGIANRFGNIKGNVTIEEIKTGLEFFFDYKEGANYENNGECIALNSQVYNLETKQPFPYPFSFRPTFHKYRLEEPKLKAKPQKIFVGSMTDLFGEWVPDSWIKEVFNACASAPQHTYLFLSKNPTKIPMTSYIYNGIFENHKNNFWFGTSINTQKDLSDRILGLAGVQGNLFLSIEPIFESIDLTKIDVDKAFVDILNGKACYFFDCGEFRKIKWVIVGAESGKRKGKVIPKREWIEKIVEQCKVASVPVFMKGSLKELMGQDFIQEWPEGLK